MKNSKLKKALVWTLGFQVLIFIIGVMPIGLTETDKINIIITINFGLIGGTIGNIITLHKNKP